MPSPAPAGRRFSFKSSHRRVTLKVSHRSNDERSTPPAPERERYIAPPKRRR
jgi:hypothetical protein